jgi:hypothetical protein
VRKHATKLGERNFSAVFYIVNCKKINRIFRDGSIEPVVPRGKPSDRFMGSDPIVNEKSCLKVGLFGLDPGLSAVATDSGDILSTRSD